MSNEITQETLREWADEADEGEEIVLGAKELRGIADMLEDAEKISGHLYEWPERD